MSDSELSPAKDKTPPSFVYARNKRRREDEYSADFQSLKEEMKNMMISLFSQQNSEIMPTLKQIQQVNINIENSIAFLTAQNEEMKKKIDHLEEKSKEDKNRIHFLEEKLEEMQKTQRKSNFEIKNVPVRKNESKEDLLEIITHLAKNVGCSLNTADVSDIYRVRGKKVDAICTSIVVETTSTIKKVEMLKMTKQFNMKQKTKLSAKHLGFKTAEDTPIFISEHLTPRSSRLYFLARDLAKSKEYRFCWTAYGKIFVRKTESSQIISIINEVQIQQLMNSDI